jgi:hypothetical protein
MISDRAILGLPNSPVPCCERDAYQPLPFMRDIEVGSYGPFCEIRTYGIAPGGLAATSDAWAKRRAAPQ